MFRLLYVCVPPLSHASYRWLWAVMLGLGTEPGAHGRAVSALNSKLSLQTEKNYFNHCTCADCLSFSPLISFIHFSFIWKHKKAQYLWFFFLEIKPIWLRFYTVQFASFKANLIFSRAYMFSQRFRDKWPPHNSFLTLTSSTKIMCYLHNLAGSGTYLLISSWGPKDLILSFCGCIWVWLCMWTGMTAIFFVVCCLGFSKRGFSV